VGRTPDLPAETIVVLAGHGVGHLPSLSASVSVSVIARHIEMVIVSLSDGPTESKEEHVSNLQANRSAKHYVR
jgi:hypothetical protein